MKEFVLVELSGDRVFRGFRTAREAWEAVGQCPNCRLSLKQGFEEFEVDGKLYRVDRSHPSRTACAAEWDVMTGHYYDTVFSGPHVPESIQAKRRAQYWARQKRSRRPRR